MPTPPPRLLAGCRLDRTVREDRTGTTWLGWHTQDGREVLVRTAPTANAAGEVLEDLQHVANQPGGRLWRQPWACAVVALPGVPWSEVAATGAVDAAELARAWGAVLSCLETLSQGGESHGGPFAELLRFTEDGWRLVRSLSAGNATPSTDLSQAAKALTHGEPIQWNSITASLQDLAETPPPDVLAAITLFRQQLQDLLAEERHRLAHSRSSLDRRGRRSKLKALVFALRQTTRPPLVHVCISAGLDGALTFLQADCDQVRGGLARADEVPPSLVWTPQTGLDPRTARGLLRSWALRRRGDESLRKEVNRELGATDDDADRLLRWISCMARLRAARLVLDAQGE